MSNISLVALMPIAPRAAMFLSMPSSSMKKTPLGFSISGFCAVLNQTSLAMLRPVPLNQLSANFGGYTDGSARLSSQPLRLARSQATISFRFAFRVSSVTTTVSL